MNSQRLAKSLIGQFPHRAFAKVLSNNDLARGVTLPGLGLDSRPARYKSLDVFRAIRATSAQVPFLRSCSPDLCPIKRANAKIMHRLRNVAAWSREALWRAVGEVLDYI